MPYDVKLPDIGEGIAEGEIVRWMVKPGDAVREDQPLVEVMTDKASVEIPSPRTGTIAALKAFQSGRTVLLGLRRPPRDTELAHVPGITAVERVSDKLYRRHSGYPGGLKLQTARDLMDKHPERLIERAVRGMLPTNRLRDVRLGRLKVYTGSTHSHDAQKPQELP